MVQNVMSDPGEFLSLALCDMSWLERNGPVLASASAAAPLAGRSLLHGDVRSDNLCSGADQLSLIDWNGVASGTRCPMSHSS